MSKTDDSTAIAMRVERGRLVPVSQYDLELLDQWHEGAELTVEVRRIKQRPLERRYFAMLNTLLKETDTGWSNTETAHQALKLAAGFVEPYKRRNGTWSSHPRSLTTFTDAELSEFVSIFEGIVLRRFGIDPETLARESPDTGFESSGAQSSTAADADDGPSAHPIPVGAGRPIDRSPPVDTPASGAPEAGGAVESTPRDTPSARGPNLRQEEWDWVRQAARMLVAATSPGGDPKVVDNQVLAIKALTPTSITPEAKEVAQLIYRHCRAVTKGDRPLDAKWVAYTARCNPSDLRAEAR